MIQFNSHNKCKQKNPFYVVFYKNLFYKKVSLPNKKAKKRKNWPSLSKPHEFS